MKNDIQSMLIRNGVRNLKEFGYPDCTSENILTEELFANFFLSMLNDNLGISANIDIAIKELIAEVNNARTK